MAINYNINVVVNNIVQGLNNLRQSLAGLQGIQSAMGGVNTAGQGLGNLFVNLGTRIRAANTAIGGSAGGLRAAAGALRLTGTAAFLVGGQFRTLGFAASAAGSIIQNFGPLVLRAFGALGPFAPLVAGVGAALIGLGAAATVGIGALAKIAEAGLQFQDKFERARNSTAALAAEFFTLSQNGKLIGAGLDDGAAAAANFAAGQELAAEQLKKLSFEAIKSEFTTEQLFTSLQSVTSALGALSPGLEANRVLTGQFARAASIAGVSAQNLGTSINQIVSGTGRITNPLQRIFNQLKDSEGIALTAQRIRQLRGEGGDKLFDELTKALDRFTKAAGDAQAKTLTGVISNFQDAFELFSGRAAEGLYKALTNPKTGLPAALDRIVTSTRVFNQKLGKEVEEFAFTAPIEKLINQVSDLFLPVGNDIINIVNVLIGFLTDIGNFLDENKDVLLDTYDTIKGIAENVGGILVDLLQLFGVSNTLGGTLRTLQLILAAINITLQLVRLAVTFIEIGLTTIALLLAGTISITLGNLLKAVSGIAAAFGADEIAKSIDTINASLSSFIDSALDHIGELSGRIDEQGGNIGKFVRQLTAARTSVKELKKETQGLKETPNEPAQKFVTVKETSTLRAEQALIEARIKFFENRSARELELVKTSAVQQNSILDSAAKFRILSEDRVAAKKEQVRAKEIAAEIQHGRNLKLLAQTQSQLEIESFIEERARIQREFNKLEPDKKREQGQKVQNELERLGLQIRQKQLENKNQEETADQRINQLLEEGNTLERERLEIQFQNLRKSRENLDQLLSKNLEAQGVVNTEGLEAQIKVLYNTHLDRIQELQTKIKDLNEEAANAGDKAFQEAGGITNLRTALIAREDAVQKAAKTKEPFEAEFAALAHNLAIETDRLRTAQLNAATQQQLNVLRERESVIQDQISKGQTTEQAGIVEITKARKEYAAVLEELLRLLKQAHQENPINENIVDSIRKTQEELRGLQTTITETVSLKVGADARNSLVDFFTSIQQNVGNAKQAFADLGKSILGMFQKLIAEKVVREFFSFLFPKEGQTQGIAGGFFSKITKALGLEPAVQQNQAADVDQEKVKSQAQKLFESVTTTKSGADILGSTLETLGADFLELEIKIRSLLTTFGNKPLTISDLGANTPEALAKLSGISDLTKGLPEEQIKEIIINTLANSDRFLKELNAGRPESERITIADAIRDGFLNLNIPALTNIPTNAPDNQFIKNQFDRLGTGKSRSFKSGNPRFDSLLDERAKATGLPADFLFLLQKAESNFNPGAVSRTGAAGLDQFTRGTGKDFGLKNIGQPGDERLIPEKTNEAAIKLLNHITNNLRDFVNEPDFLELIVAAYTGGSNLKDVTKLRELIKTNPDTIRDIKEIRKGLGLTSEATLKQNLELEHKASVEAIKQQVKIPSIPKPGEEPPGYYITAPGKSITPNPPTEIPKLGQEPPGYYLTPSGKPITAQPVIAPGNVQASGAPVQTQVQGTVQTQVQGNVATTATNLTNDLVTPLTQYFTSLENVIIQQVAYKLDIIGKNIETRIIPLLETISVKGTETASNQGGLDFSGILGSFGGVGDEGAARGGHVYQGRIRRVLGGLVPTRVSNGEYLMSARAVQAYGSRFFDHINGFASGGEIDLSKFDYSKGGASLLKLPEPIKELAKATAKKPSRWKGILGSILSIASPFLNFIPVVGPLLSQFAKIGGAALSGAQTGGLGGAILGGVGALGGILGGGGFATPGSAQASGIQDTLSGAEGIGGKLKALFDSKTKFGKSNLFGGLGGVSGLLGNAGGSIQILLQLLSTLGLTGRSGGGLIRGFSQGGGITYGGTKLFEGLGLPSGSLTGDSPGTLKNLFNPSGGGGLSGNLGGILSIVSTLLGGLFRKGPKEPEPFQDPDLERRNKYGSGFDALVALGRIPGFQYLPETARKLGITDLSQIQKATGGFIMGPGTGTSDSIPALLSNGEYVIRADAVKNLGVGLLDSLNSVRLRNGGMVGNLSTNLAEMKTNTTNVDARTRVVNVMDPNMLQDYLNTSDGERAFLNVISKNPQKIKNILR